MNEVTLEVAAGLNSTLTQVAAALGWVLACVTSALLDEEGQVSPRSLQQVRGEVMLAWVLLVLFDLFLFLFFVCLFIYRV